MGRQIIDFGTIKVVQPAEPITPIGWLVIRAGASLASRGLKLAASTLIDAAGMMTWPPKKHRTTSVWTEAQQAFALANHGQIDAYQLARMISTLGPQRSATAVEKWLNQRGHRVMWTSIGRDRGERIAEPRFVPQDDRVHVAAVYAADRFGFAPLAARRAA